MGCCYNLSLSLSDVVLTPRKARLKSSFIISCKTRAINMSMKTNFYKVLSLESETASIDEIKIAYRSLARRYHPDVCPPSMKEESTKMFIELRQAYETLSNPTLRSMYDNELRIKCCRERWQAQLHELRLRSDRREKLKTSNGN